MLFLVAMPVFIVETFGCRDMSGNLLSSLDPNSFSIYQSLETLDLSQNLFTRVPSESLQNLSISSL